MSNSSWIHSGFFFIRAIPYAVVLLARERITRWAEWLSWTLTEQESLGSGSYENSREHGARSRELKKLAFSSFVVVN
jgi:hypothetical protein